MKKPITYTAMRKLIGKAISDKKIATTTTQGDFGPQEDYTAGEYTYRKAKKGPSAILHNDKALDDSAFPNHEEAIKEAFKPCLDRKGDDEGQAIIAIAKTKPDLVDLLEQTGRKLSFAAGRLHVSAKPKKQKP